MPRNTLARVIASLLPERRSDSPLTRVLFRPRSFFAAWLFLQFGWNPNAVTYLSAVLSLAGFFFLSAGPIWTAWVGLCTFFIFSIIDCADGNMARVRKTTSPWSEWVDAFGGHTAYTKLLLGAGASAQAVNASSLSRCAGAVLPWAGGWTFVGGAAAASNFFMRMICQGPGRSRPTPDEQV